MYTQRSNNQRRTLIDVMVKGYFYKQIEMLTDARYPISMKDVERYAYDRLPSLIYKDNVTIEISKQKVFTKR